jgi:predicted nucleotidyltransferase
LAKELELSKGLISKYLDILDKFGIVNKSKRFRVNLEDPITRSLKIFFNLRRIDLGRIKKNRHVLGIGLYGSWATGTNTRDSDVDIWLKLDKRLSEDIVAGFSADISRKTGYEVSILILTPDRIKRLRNEDRIFYHSLVFGSILLWGEDIEV